MEMNKYKTYSVIIIAICIVISLGIGITGYYEYQKLKSSQSALEHYKTAPKNLLNPEPGSFNNAYVSTTTKLIIPHIGLNCWVRSDTVNAYDSVYHYAESVLPGQNGECGLLGHRTTYSGPFKKLGSLRIGDEVIIEDLVLSKKYTYKVTSNGKDIRWDYETNPIKFAQDGDARLMLITCYPPGKKKAAWITHCKLVKTEEI
jgi:sortase A